MRLIRTKIYRAFPELDRFDDARCERFIQAVRGGTGRRLAVRAQCILVGIVVIVVPPMTLGLMIGWLESALALGSDLAYPTFVGASFIAMIAAPFVGVLTRDALLRRRIRHMLNARGTCLTCSHSLLGLPVGTDLRVICPECQSISQVDAAIGALSVAASGTNLDAPARATSVSMSLAQNPRRGLRRFLRLALPAAAVLFAVAWTGYENFLWRQANAAIALKPGTAGLLAYAQTLQPAPAGEQDEDLWILYTKAREHQGRVDAILGQTQPPMVGGQPVLPEFSAVAKTASAAGTTDAERKLFRAQASEAERYLKAYGEQGLWETFDAIARAKRGVMPLSLPQSVPAAQLLLPELKELRSSATLLTARMTVAARSGNGPHVASAYRTLLALARLAQMQPLAIQYLTGQVIENFANGRLRVLMMVRPDVFDLRTLDALSAATIEQRWTPPANHPWEGERLSNLDTVAWVFSRASNVRFGKFSTALRRTNGIFWSSEIDELPEGSLGTFDGVRAELEARARDQMKLATIPCAERLRTPGSSPSSNVLIRSLGIKCEPFLRARDRQMLERNGTSAMLLIERFRRENGRVPNSLEEAVGNARDLSLIDPFSDKPLLYKAIDAQADRLQRPYLIYGVGADLCDNGGKTPSDPDYSSAASLKPSSSAITPADQLDFVINDDR